MLVIDPGLFLPSAIPPEVTALNDEIVAKLALLPDPWAFPPSVLREIRQQGRGPFPLPPQSLRAEVTEIPGPRGSIPLRIMRPEGGKARGVYLHLHFGGWTLGSTDMHDPLLVRIADTTGLVVVSVEYRLAPEFPYPAGPDDCEAAALAMLREAPARFGCPLVAIGGESAGAHLSVVVMTRLRDRHGLTPFRAAALTAGCYDLALTPSARSWGTRKLILNTRDIETFTRFFVPAGLSLRDPDVSPLHANLAGLPTALLTIGTADPLLDDSLFMATRWAAAGNGAELAVYPGGAHVFQMFDNAQTEACLTRTCTFLAERTA